jgi:hypothetical protein
MTSPLRRKRRITARGRSTPPAMLSKSSWRRLGSHRALLFLLTLVTASVLVSAAAAQEPVSTIYTAYSPGAASSPGAAGSPGEPGAGVTQALFEAQPGQPPGQPVRPAAAQAGRPKDYDDETIDLPIQTEPPDPARLFERDSEASWKTRIVELSRRKMGGPRIIFPDYEPLARTPLAPRFFPPLTELVEPGFVMHGRLLFEQPNLERYGWDLGILTPAVSAVGFYKDVVLLPYHWWTRPLQRYDTSAGKCLPGDPTPLLLYPPELSLTGLIGEAGAIITGFYTFP